MSYTSLFKFLICYEKDQSFNPHRTDSFDGSDVHQHCLNGIICQTDVNEGTGPRSVPFFLFGLYKTISPLPHRLKLLLPFIISMLLGGNIAFAQGTLLDKKASARFYSEAPVENIEATNSKVVGALDISTGNLAVSMLMRDFEFEKSLMQEHFNENYVESDKYPKSTFKGKILNYDADLLSKPGNYTFKVSGELTIHGVTNPLNTEIQCKVSNNTIAVSTKFMVEVASFEIDIPKIVFYNIAEEVEVTASFNFQTTN